MTTPNINLDVNVTKGSSSTYRSAVQDAYLGVLSEGDPLAASYNHATDAHAGSLAWAS